MDRLPGYEKNVWPGWFVVITACWLALVAGGLILVYMDLTSVLAGNDDAVDRHQARNRVGGRGSQAAAAPVLQAPYPRYLGRVELVVYYEVFGLPFERVPSPAPAAAGAVVG